MIKVGSLDFVGNVKIVFIELKRTVFVLIVDVLLNVGEI